RTRQGRLKRLAGRSAGSDRNRLSAAAESAASTPRRARLRRAPACRRRQLTTALSTAGFDDLDAARTRHAGAESVDFNPLALLWLVGTLHGNDWFRALTIAWRCRGATLVPSICRQPAHRCAYGISDCAANRHLAIIPLPWRATASNL